jgi:type I restriction enzyme S subunit
MNKFKEVSESLFDKVKSNQQQIQTLEKLRDNLLPKLMSGEVRVSLNGEYHDAI